MIRAPGSAEADLFDIGEHYRLHRGAAQAVAYLDALEARISLLAASPGVGHRRPDLASRLLCFPADSHVIYYTEDAHGILVVRVLHKRQDPALQME